MVLKKVGALEHLLTEIHVNLKKLYSYLDFVNALHPTAALGVYPKEKLSSWIGRLPGNQDRKFFGGPFGVESPDGHMHCYVAIRNIELENNKIRIGAGCGIVKTSDPQKEWQELFAKRNAVKRIFNL